MKYAAEMISGAMMYITVSLTSVQVLKSYWGEGRGVHRQTTW
jgi:hypothetical protein